VVARSAFGPGPAESAIFLAFPIKPGQLRLHTENAFPQKLRLLLLQQVRATLMHKCEWDSTVSVKAGCLEGFDLRGSKRKTAVHIRIKEAIVDISEGAEAYEAEPRDD
jgi:hypothetical protein